MSCALAGADSARIRRRRPFGFSLLELVVTLAVMMIATAIAVPLVANAIAQFKMNSAVLSTTGIIQATRYRAISSGYPYRVVFSSAALTYQVQSDPNSNGTFSNVGTAVPIASASINPVMNADITLQFRPNGTVSTIAGALPMTLTLKNQTKTITVGTYGNIDVTPP